MSTTFFTTADELLRLPSGKARYELVRGELRTMSPAGSEHGAIIGRLTIRLGKHVEDNDLGEVFGAETGFLLERDPDTVLGPDVAFVRKERLAETGYPQAYYPGAPDLAVEVISPSETVASVDEKARQWLAAGARLVWNLRPLTRSVEIYRQNGQIEVLNADEELAGEDVVPGFACRVEELFPRR